MRSLGFLAVHRSPDVDGIEPPVVYVKSASFAIQWEDCHQRTASALLRPRRFRGMHICIVNVHLAGAPGEGRQRIGQVRKALQRAEQESDSQHLEGEVLFLLVGDFNEAPQEGALYRLLTEGDAAPDADIPGDKAEWKKWCFTDTYAVALGKACPPTWPVPGPRRRIDYILTSSGAECVGVPAPLQPDSDNYPSDHLLIATDLQMQSEEEDADGSD